MEIKIRKVCELVISCLDIGPSELMVIDQAMKMVRADLSNEGRVDILEKTMPYRAGRCVHLARKDKYICVCDIVHGRVFSRGRLAR
jgi:hypothetical protein